MEYKRVPIIIVGSGKMVYSVTVCLLLAEHPVTLVTGSIEKANQKINDLFFELPGQLAESSQTGSLKIVEEMENLKEYAIGIAIIEEDESEKKSAIQMLEKNLIPGSVILINTESIPLSLLQEASAHPECVIGANWAEPAHTTQFLELITNDKNDVGIISEIVRLAKSNWKKDPYILTGNVGIRGKLFSAMVREAFYLVHNEYASIEDIDRACRNDAGYYLPFAGNFRYMDLMGTYAYGLVMKDLNPDLSKEDHVAIFFEKIVEQGGQGMENNRGFYGYEKGEAERWNETFRKFSYQIQQVINKYPFAPIKENCFVDNTTTHKN